MIEQSGSGADAWLSMAWFPTAMPKGPAYGDPEQTTWGEICGIVTGHRRFGPKDGPGFCAARFKLEEDGRQVRRLKENLASRTAIALDIDPNKATGEIPPVLDELAKRIETRGWAAALWTSHSHNPPNNIRYRVLLPLSVEIDHTLPAVDIIAAVLGVAGVLDTSKLGASSYFYLPSCPEDAADLQQEIIVPGAPIDAQWLTERATALQEARKAEEERQAAEAHKAAQARREAHLVAGFDLSDSLIKKIRQKLPSLAQILLDHRYDSIGTDANKKFRHPNSKSGSYGADIKEIKGVERVYSFNGTDPLHNENHALDSFEVVTILDFGGDRDRALRELAERFGLSKAAEQRVLASLIFKKIRDQAAQVEIEDAAFAEGERLGLTPSQVCAVARWCDAEMVAA